MLHQICSQVYGEVRLEIDALKILLLSPAVLLAEGHKMKQFDIIKINKKTKNFI